MNVRNLFVPAIAAGLLLGGASLSHAQSFFNYTSTLTPVSITNNGVTVNVGPPVSDTNDNAAGTGTAVRAGGFNVSEAPVNSATFNGSYNDAFFITDVASGQSGTVNYMVNLTTTANSTQVVPGSTQITYTPGVSSITLGANTYFVSLNNFDETTPPGSNNFGSFSSRVQASPVPEPGSIALLVGMGISGSAFVVRRRKTRA